MGCGVKLVVLATAALLLLSCASQAPSPAQAPQFKSIAFVTSKDLPELTRPESESEVVERHVYAGAAAGTVGGAAVGAVACGPVLYGVCIAIMSWYGLVAGSVGGAALGLYDHSGLSYTDSAYVELVLAGIDDRRDFHSDLRKQVILRIPAETIVAPQDADIQIVVRVNQISFIEIEKELISTEMYAAMILARAQEPEEQTYREVFAAKAPAKDIDDLIAGDGQLLESAIDECLSEIAKLMSNRLDRLWVEGADELMR